MSPSLTELANAQQLAALLPFTRVAVVLFTAHWSPESDHARATVLRAARRLQCRTPPIFEVPLSTHVLQLQPVPYSPSPASSASALVAGAVAAVAAAAAAPQTAAPTPRAFWNLAAPRRRAAVPSPRPVRWSLPWLPSVSLFTNVTAEPFVPHTYNDSFDARALARHIDSFCFAALSEAAAKERRLDDARSGTGDERRPAEQQPTDADPAHTHPSPYPTVFAPRPPDNASACTPPPPSPPSPRPALAELAATRDAFAAALSGGARRAALVVAPGGLSGLPRAVAAALGAAAAAGWTVAVSDADAEPALAAWAGGSHMLVLADGPGDRVARLAFARDTGMATVAAQLRAFADGARGRRADPWERRRRRRRRRRRGARRSGDDGGRLRDADARATGVPARPTGWGAALLSRSCAARDESTWVFVMASWCAYCQRLQSEATALARAATDVEGVHVRFVRLDTLDSLPAYARDLVDGVPTVLRVRSARGWTDVEEYVGPHDVRAMVMFHDERVAALLRERLPHDGG